VSWYHKRLGGFYQSPVDNHVAGKKQTGNPLETRVVIRHNDERSNPNATIRWHLESSGSSPLFVLCEKLVLQIALEDAGNPFSRPGLMKYSLFLYAKMHLFSANNSRALVASSLQDST